MIKRKLLAQPQALTENLNPVYTTPTAVSTQVMGCTIHNPTDGNAVVTVHYVAKDDSADTTNAVLRKALLEGESYACPELVNHTLPEGMTIYASGAGATITVSGAVIS